MRMEKPFRNSVARMCRVATKSSLRLLTASLGQFLRSWITQLARLSWYSFMRSAKPRRTYVRNDNVLTWAAMKSWYTPRCALVPIGAVSRSARIMSGIRLPMLASTYCG